MTANSTRTGAVNISPNCNIMALNSSRQDIIGKRREDVARYRLRGWTQRQIAEQLNVSVATVNRDLAFLQDEWRAAALATIEEHKTRVLAELAEVKRRAHAADNLSAVTQALKLEVELLGLNEPVKSNVDFTSGGQRITTITVVRPPKSE